MKTDLRILAALSVYLFRNISTHIPTCIALQ